MMWWSQGPIGIHQEQGYSKPASHLIGMVTSLVKGNAQIIYISTNIDNYSSLSSSHVLETMGNTLYTSYLIICNVWESIITDKQYIKKSSPGWQGCFWRLYSYAAHSTIFRKLNLLVKLYGQLFSIWVI